MVHGVKLVCPGSAKLVMELQFTMYANDEAPGMANKTAKIYSRNPVALIEQLIGPLTDAERTQLAHPRTIEEIDAELEQMERDGAYFKSARSQSNVCR